MPPTDDAAPPDVPAAVGAETSAPLRDVIWRAMLRVLLADPDAPYEREKGRWPSTWATFMWDLAPHQLAPNADGVVGPQWSAPDWVAVIAEADLVGAVEEERARHRDARDAVVVLEQKASRLLAPMVTLLTGTATFLAFELHVAAGAKGAGETVLSVIGSAMGALAVLLLFMAVIRALDADTRVGVYRPTSTGTRAKGFRSVLEEEALGTALASWTLRKKVTRLMFARAALSRAVVLLFVALICAAIGILIRA